MKHKNKSLILIIVLATTIMGQVYAKPFNTDFRISVGIIILTVLLLRFKDVPVIFTCGLTGVSIFLFRFLLDYTPNTTGLDLLFFKHFPSAMFYLFFGIFLYLLNFREVVSKPVFCLVVLALSDVGANTMELAIRGDLGVIDPEIASVSIVLTGGSRALISYLLYLSEKFYTLLIINKGEREKYKEFVMMRASIKSEIFFMQKSMEDIEESMKESFAIYRLLNSKDDGLTQEEVKNMKQRVLGISKGIHEIKKDYNRIIAGMGNVVPDVGFSKFKDSDEVLNILKEVTEKYILKTGKNIDFTIEIKDHFKIYYYFPLLSVLNNLIINAIDAIENQGWIHVQVKEDLETLSFIVSDNGCGIKEKNMEAIFNPGFSTKFDRHTGKMSTGIGLTHVKSIVERSLDGHIAVTSLQKMTQFTIVVSKHTLLNGGINEER